MGRHPPPGRAAYQAARSPVWVFTCGLLFGSFVVQLLQTMTGGRPTINTIPSSVGGEHVPSTDLAAVPPTITPKTVTTTRTTPIAVPASPAAAAAAADDDAAASECPTWTVRALVQKEIQRDFCIRRFDPEAPGEGVAKAQIPGPNGTALPFAVYDGGDAVSRAVLEGGRWEGHLSDALVKALSDVAERRGLRREQVTLLDIGGNVGTHTVFAQAAGFSAITFEPLPPNEAIIRTNLCYNDPEQARVTYFTKGLGSEPMLCKQYSADAHNKGNGVVSCDGKAPVIEDDAPLTYRGQMEVVRLDDVLLPCGRLPPGVVFGAMKMDVEGFEPQVLKGAAAFLTQARIPYIVFEIQRMQEAEQREVLSFFYDLGYHASWQWAEDVGQPEHMVGWSSWEDVFLVLREGEGAIEKETTK